MFLCSLVEQDYTDWSIQDYFWLKASKNMLENTGVKSQEVET